MIVEKPIRLMSEGSPEINDGGRMKDATKIRGP